MADNYDKPGQLPDELSTKPGGGRWRQCELQAARMRAEGSSWPAVARAVGYQESTVRNYTCRDWWRPLYDHFVQQVHTERALERKRRRQSQQRQFREREQQLVEQGTILALSTLISCMRGSPPTGPDGQPIGDWPQGPPSWQVRAIAASQFLKMAGYHEAKKQLSKISVEAIQKAAQATEAIDGIDLDLSITGVDDGAQGDT